MTDLRRILPDPVHLATAIAGEDITNDVMKVEQQFSQKRRVQNVSTAQLLPMSFLHRIVIQTAVNGKTITLLDGTTPMGVITCGTPAAGVSDPKSLEYNVSIASGFLSITPNDTGLDLLVVYR